MQGKSLIPPIKWAQRRDRIFLTVEIRDIKNEKIDLQPGSLKFTGQSDGNSYEFQLNLCEDISVEESKTNISGFALHFILIKKDQDKPYWSRLTKEVNKFQHIQVDWIKYIDEDDEQEEGGKGLEGGDWDANKFQDFQGGAQDEDDEDERGDYEGEGDDDENQDEGDDKEEVQFKEEKPLVEAANKNDEKGEQEHDKQ